MTRTLNELYAAAQDQFDNGPPMAPMEVIGPVTVKRPWWLCWAWWIPKEREVPRYKLKGVWTIGR